MRYTDYCDAIRLVNSALAVVDKPTASRAESLRRQLRKLALELDLLRIRLRQVPAATERN